MWSASSRNALIAIRVVTGLVTGTSLGFFIVIAFKVLDDIFPSARRGISILPIAALSLSIIYNVLAIATTHTRLSKLFHVAGDVLTAIVVAALVSVAVAHDSKEYLGNGMWTFYDQAGWLDQEIAGGVFAAVSFVMQLLLAGLSFRAYRRERVVVPQQFDVEVTRTGSPPGYANSLSESLKDVLERDIVEDEEKKGSVKEVRWGKKEMKRSVKV